MFAVRGVSHTLQLSAVVFQMLVGSVTAETKATKELRTISTTTQSRLRTVIPVIPIAPVPCLVHSLPTSVFFLPSDYLLPYG
jgi:hypothetical protein